MAADGSIVIDVELNDGSIVQGTADITDQLNQLGNDSDGVFKKLGKGFKGLASVAAVGVGAVAGVGAAVVGLAKPLVEAAAATQALNSQFSQVFGDLETQATDALNKIGKETSILPDRLKGSFTMMAAFAKTTGMDSAKALDLTSRATLAAADSAAFYDKSIEEVSENLQSFLKGNYENDAALGISATEFTRNAAAADLFGKKFKDLTEEQKQFTLLDMVEQGNKLSGAMGQASREGDGLENVVGNLKMAWENLKVKLGEPILEPAIVALKLLTKVLENFDVTPFINAFQTIQPIVADVFNGIKTYVQTAIDTIRDVWSTHGTSIVDAARNIFESIKETVLPILEGVIETIKNVIGYVKTVWEQDGQAILERLTNIFNSVKAIVVPIVEDAIQLIITTFGKVKEFWDTNGQQIVQAVSNIFQGILAVVEFIMPAVKFIIDYVWDAIKNVITGALDVIMGAVKIFSGLFTGDWSKMWEGIKQTLSGAVDLILGIMSLTFIGGIRTALVNLGKTGISLIKGMWDDIAKLFTGAGSAITNTVSKMATAVVNWFKNIWTQGSNIFGTLRTFGATTFNALQQAVTTTVSGLVTSVIRFITNLKTNFINLISSLKTNVTTKFQEIKDEIIDKVKSIDLMQIGKDIVNGLINGIGAMFTSVKTTIEELASSLPEWMKKILGIHSPSRVMKEIGKWVGIGLAEGISDAEKQVAQTMEDLAYVLIDVTDNTIKQEKEILKKANDEIAKLQKDSAEKIAALEKSSSNKILGIQESASKKKKGMTATQQRSIVTSRTDTANKIVKIEEETAAKVVKIQQKAQSDSAKIVAANQKALLDEIKLFVEDKKSLEEMSVLEEIAIWDKAAGLFEQGTKEKVEAQKAYAKALDEVNNEVMSVNEKYTKEMSRISSDLQTAEKKLTDEYEKALADRAKALYNFANMFDEFDIKTEKSGEELLKNLGSQVDGFKKWQEEIEKLAARAIDDGLIAELTEMGPKALGEIQALNSLSETELQKYSDLYKEKAALARTQAEAELAPMKEVVDSNISEMRKTANTELSRLEADWVRDIRDITSVTSRELGTLETVGRDAVAGLQRGLKSMHAELRETAKSLADTISETTIKALDIHSPSRVMAKIGGFIVEGLMVGMRDEAGNLSAEALVLSKQLTDVFSGEQAAAPGLFESIDVDKETLKLAELAQKVNEFTDKTAVDSKSLTAPFNEMRKVVQELYKDIAYLNDGELFEYMNNSEMGFVDGNWMSLGAARVNEYNAALRQVAAEEALALKEFEENTVLKFAFQKQYVEQAKKLNHLSLLDELQLYQDFATVYKANSEEYKYFSDQITDIRTNRMKELFDAQKAEIDYQKSNRKVSLVEEEKMYKEFASYYEKDSDQYKYFIEKSIAVRRKVNDTLMSLNVEYADKIRKATQDLEKNTLKIEETASKDREKIIKDANAQLVKNEEDYNKKVLDLKESAANQEKSIIENRKKALYDFAGIFDKVSKKEGITGKRLMIALQSQVDTFKKWQTNLNNLSKKGIDKDLLADLEAMGPEAATEIAALNSLSAKELQEYGALWREKSSVVTKQVNNELGDMNSNTSKQITQMRSDTAIQLAQYEADFHTTNASIRANQQIELDALNAKTAEQLTTLRADATAQLNAYEQDWKSAISSISESTKNDFNAMVEEMPVIGQNVIEGMMQGLADMAPTLMGQVKAIAESMKSTIQSALDIHSPSRWARNFIMGNLAKGFVLGADDNKGMISGAAGKMAEWLKPDLKLNTNIGKNGLYVGRLTPPVSSTTNSTSSHTDQSKHVSATFNFDGSGNSARDVKRAWREMAFKMGV